MVNIAEKRHVVPATAPQASTAWEASIPSDAVECPEPKAFKVLSGRLPPLRGVYLRNGPGQLNAHGTPLKNLIDGAGFAQTVTFGGSDVYLRARFVQTATKQKEDREGKAVFGGFSQLCPSGLKGHLRGKGLRYTANTNLVGHAGKLYAAYENDWFYRLSPTDLSTEAHDNLGLLRPAQRLSAHPKLDPATGDMHNIGCEYTYRVGIRGVSVTNRLWFYNMTLKGAATAEASVELPYPAALVHDMALTKRHTVAVVSPLLLRPTLGVVAGLSAADQAVVWEGGRNSLVVAHRRGTSTVKVTPYPATLCFHTVNAFEAPDGALIVDTCNFADGDVVRITADMVQGRSVGHHYAKLHRLQQAPDGTWSSRLLSDTPLDWPRVSPGYAGRPYNFVFGNTWDDDSPLPDVPVRLDLDTGKTLKFSLARPFKYAGEPLPVRKPNARAEQDVYVLSMVFESGLSGHVLHIWDGADPLAAALCRLESPSSLPYGFHTNWMDHDDTSGCALPF